ncbi:AAA family ATPase [Paenirhodobacter populi]|nr:AAA family ATPase [Sinirhodobacter populi]
MLAEHNRALCATKKLCLIASNGVALPSAYANSGPQQDFSQTAAHLAALDLTPDTPVNFRAIHDKDKGVPAIKRYGTLNQLWPELCEWNNKGYGIFLTVSQMDGQGDKIPNVQAIRACYLDLDSLDAMANLQRAQWHMPMPSFYVQSSPNKAHVYWPLDQLCAPGDWFGETQAKLAQVYDGDPRIIDPTRVMRLAGFYHQKGAPVLSTFHTLPGYGCTAQAGALMASLAHVNVIQHGGGLRQPLGTPELAAPSMEWLNKALARLDPNSMARDEWIAFTAAFKQAAWSVVGQDAAFAMWWAWCTRYAENDPAENLKQWNDITETQVGWRWLEEKADLRAERIFGTPAPGAPRTAPPIPGTQSLLSPLSTLMKQPQSANWLIKVVLPANSAGVMFGQPGTGKSFMAIDMAASVATGALFNGRKVKPGPVVYIAGEGHGGVTNRFIAKFNQIGNPPGAENIHVSRKSISLLDTDDELESLVREIDGLPTKPVLIVVDTLFRATAGADVNNHDEMSKFWKNIDHLKERYGCTILIVHHSGRNETTRSFGSIVLLANADFEMSIKSDDNGKTIECTKQKDAEEFAPMHFDLKRVTLAWDIDMEPITSCTIEFMERVEGDRTKEKETRKIGAEYETPSRAPSRKLGAMLVKVHDIISETNGIALSETLLNLSIPKDLVDDLCRTNGIHSSDKRDAIKGLAAPSGKVAPWVNMDENESFRVTLRLAKYARESEYDENSWDNFTLSAEQIAMCKLN